MKKFLMISLSEPHAETCECERCQAERRGERVQLPPIKLTVKGDVPLEYEVEIPPILPSILIELELDEIFS